MGNYTGNLNLYKADPVTDGNDTFNIDTMLNENWDKIDLAAVPIFETTGTASALVVEGLILADKIRIQIKLHVAIADNATLNGKPILTSEGENISSGAVAGSFLLLAYNENRDSWFQIGGSGGGFLIKIAGSDKKAYFEFNPEDGIVYVKEA